MMHARHLALALLLFALAVGCAAAQDEGTYRGKIITVGEDRIVVAVPDHGQVTLEVRFVQDGAEWVPDRAQIAQIKTLQPDQMVEVKWFRGDGGHFRIAELSAGPAGGARQGLVTGTVVTADEGRVVVTSDAGGQVTLEPAWMRRNGEWVRDPFHEVFAQGLQPGDRVVALWELDEGTHFVLRGISKLDAEGQALALALLLAELRETYGQVNQLQDQIGELRGMVDQVLHQLKGAGQ